MKACVFVSSDCGIDSVPSHKYVYSLPDRIIFSEYEEYASQKEFDTEQFIMRIRMDNQAKPIIKGASEDTTIDILAKAVRNEFDAFIVLLNMQKMIYYRPIIEEFMKNNSTIQVHFLQVESLFYPMCYMATTIVKMMESDKTIDEVKEFISFVNKNSGIFIYSPEEEKYPSIQRFSYDDDLLKITGNNNYFYIIHQNTPTTYRVKEKIKNLEHYLKMFKVEIENKKVLPFIVYTDAEAVSIKIYRNLIEKQFPKVKYKEYLMSPEAVLEYGKYACGIGYIVDNKE